MFHSTQIQRAKCWLQSKKCFGYSPESASSQKRNKRVMKVAVTQSQRGCLGVVDLWRQPIGVREVKKRRGQLWISNQQRATAAFQDFCGIEAKNGKIAY